MGLLDFKVDEEDDFLPNFNSSWAPPKPTNPELEKSASNSSDTSAPRTSSTTKGHRHRSSTSSTSDSKSNDQPSSSSNAASDSMSSDKRPVIRGKERRRTRGMSFDLYGDDDELQKAESTIRWCEICLRHCDVH